MKQHLLLLIAIAIAPSFAAEANQNTIFTKSPFGAVIESRTAETGTRLDTALSNRVAIINNGYDALLLRVHLIRNATRSIEIQTFIWTNDEVGRLMMCELIEAARRGVKVRIIADHMVTEKDPDTIAFLATVSPNLEIKHYRPTAKLINPSKFRTAMSGLFGLRDLNQRMHNKLMVFDGAIMITGGRNIENTYYNHSTEMNFKDRDVLAIGPVACEAEKSFEEFWKYKHSITSSNLADVAAVIRQNKFRRYEKRDDYDFGSFFLELAQQADSPAEITARFCTLLHQADRVSLLADKPGKNNSFLFWGQGHMAHKISKTIREAKDSVVIQSPYMVLSHKAADMFREIKKRKPSPRIVISSNSFGSTDNIMAYSGNYRLRALHVEDLGLEIHEYRPLPSNLKTIFPQYDTMKALALRRIERGEQKRSPFLCIHAKSFTVDNRLAFIGSFNLDPRSENLNTEVGLLIEGTTVAAELKNEIMNDAGAANSWVIAKRAKPLYLDKVNKLVNEIMDLSPIDIWPIQNTTSFEIIPGRQEVMPGHHDFYKNYREAGDFPGSDGHMSTKEIITRLYKTIGPVMTPML